MIKKTLEPQLGLQKMTEVDLHERIISAAIQMGYAFACWRLPNESTVHLVVDINQAVSVGKVLLEDARPGFVVSPFLNPHLDQTHFISADIHFSSKQSSLMISDYLAGEAKSKAEHFIEKLSGEKNPTNNQFSLSYKKEALASHETSDDFKLKVALAKTAIKRGDFKKVVLSRTKKQAVHKNYNPVALFKKLLQSYPNAFISYIAIPGLGSWMGASPETLVSIKDNRYFKTVALAGTLQANNFEQLEDVAWTQKEIEEQALVARYIVDCFKKIRLREFDEDGPKTVKAGNLIHLKTVFGVDMKATNYEQLGSVMLDLLHPTSAVCGTPLEASRKFILSQENYDRELYSGFIGPVNIDQQTNVFVNLRCMQLFDEYIKIYAGAGITGASQPDKEWMETEYKCDTMLKVIERSF